MVNISFLVGTFNPHQDPEIYKPLWNLGCYKSSIYQSNRRADIFTPFLHESEIHLRHFGCPSLYWLISGLSVRPSVCPIRDSCERTLCVYMRLKS